MEAQSIEQKNANELSFRIRHTLADARWYYRVDTSKMLEVRRRKVSNSIGRKAQEKINMEATELNETATSVATTVTPATINAADQSTTSHRSKRVDNVEIGRLSRHISNLEKGMIDLKHQEKDAKDKLAKRFTWTTPTSPDDLRKRIKVALSTTDIRDLRILVDQSRRDQKETEISLKRGRAMHTKLAADARRQAKLEREVISLKFKAENDSLAFLRMVDLRLQEVTGDDKSVMIRLPERYKSEPTEAKKDLMGVIERSFPGTFQTLREKPSLKAMLFSSVFGEKQDGDSQA